MNNITQYHFQEMSWFHLINLFWKHKKIILVATMFGLTSSLTYIYLNKPVYQSQSILTPPIESDIFSLNFFSTVDTKLKKTYKIKEIFQRYIERLDSIAFKNFFFEEVYLPSLTEEQKSALSPKKVLDSYLTSIFIKQNPSINGNRYVISMRADSSLKSTKLINQYLALAQKKTSDELVDEVRFQNNALLKSINFLKELEKDKRVELLNHYKEVITLAKESGISSISINPLQDTSSSIALLEAKFSYYSNLSQQIKDIKMFRSDEITSQLISINYKTAGIFGILVGLFLGCLTVVLKETYMSLKNRNVLSLSKGFL